MQFTSGPSLGSLVHYNLFYTELWISALIVAVYCSSALNAIPENSAAVGETVEGGGPNQFDYKRSTSVCGYLWVKVRNAQNLHDPDYRYSAPDPYTRITANKSDGSSFSSRTTTVMSEKNPKWNQWLEMGWFTGFEVQVWDDNIRGGADKKYLNQNSFMFPLATTVTLDTGSPTIGILICTWTMN